LSDAFHYFLPNAGPGPRYVPVLAGRFLSNAVVDKTAWQQIDDDGRIFAEDWMYEVDCCSGFTWSLDLPMCQGGAARSGKKAGNSAKASAAKASAAKASAAKAE